MATNTVAQEIMMIVTTRTAGPRFGMPLLDEAARSRKGVEDMSYPDITMAVLRET